MGARYIPRTGLEYVPDITFPEISRYIVNTNDLIISIVGTIGLVSIIDGYFNNASQTENCAKLSGLDECDAKYLYYFLRSNTGQAQIKSATVGAVQAKLPLYNIEKINVYWPMRFAREKITNTLDSLDNKIELNIKTNQTLESIAQAIFKSWFVDFDPVKAKIAALEAGGTQEAAELAAMCVISGKDEAQLAQLKIKDTDAYQQLAQTAALFPAAMQESELGEVPTGWDILKIESVLQRLSVKNRYTKTDVETYGQIPVFEQGVGILLGYHNNQAEVQASPENPAFIFGDHTCVMHLACRPFDVSANVIALRGNKYPTIWTYYAILGKQQFQEYRRHWSELAVKELIAPQDTALAFAFENLIKNNVLLRQERLKESSSLSNLRDSLLPKLLSGEIDLAGIEFKNE